MPPRASLQSFLATARSTLACSPNQRTGPLTLVVGNESADLDSLCSAVLYAYMRSHDATRSLHIPLCNLPRADLGLRREMTTVLHRAGLGPADLLTLSDLPDLRPADTRWVLVDHNALTGPLARFAPQVVGCVDHHRDEASVPRHAVPRIIERCGSCMSLIVDQSRQAWDALTAQDARGDGELASLGLAPILIDTVNLTAGDKVTGRDMSAVRYLEDKMQGPGRLDRTRYFDQLSAVKGDLSHLSLRDILRKDYKAWHESGITLGVSCVVQGFPYLIDKAGGTQNLLDHVTSWSSERRLDIVAVMTTSHPDGEFQRHLLVWGLSERGRAAVAGFAETASHKLRLQPWQGGELDEDTRFVWRQGELAASRKQVAPLLREAMSLV